MGGWGEEEAQYLVLLKLWEDVGDTWRHQLTVIRISEQFAVAGEERRRGVGSGGRGGGTQFISFCQDVVGSHSDCVSLRAKCD